MILMHGIYNKQPCGFQWPNTGKGFDGNFSCQARSIHFENKVGTSGHFNLNHSRSMDCSSGFTRLCIWCKQ